MYVHTEIHTEKRPSDEAGSRRVFAPKNPNAEINITFHLHALL